MAENKVAPGDVRRARLSAGLNQDEAGKLVFAGSPEPGKSRRTWQNYEHDGTSGRKMPLVAFAWFCQKTGQDDLFREVLRRSGWAP